MCENQEKSLHSVTMPQKYLYVTLAFTRNDEFTMKLVKLGFFQTKYLPNPQFYSIFLHCTSRSDLFLHFIFNALLVLSCAFGVMEIRKPPFSLIS